MAGLIGENEYDHWQNFDVGLMKLDPDGKVQFRVKDTYSEEADSLTQTSDGGYAIAGRIVCSGGKKHFGIVKTDSNGNMKWKEIVGKA